MDDKTITESDILAFWDKNKIYDKAKKKNAKGKKFYMVDGPPYANGHIHMGHALNKTLKDISMRSMRLQGRDVFDRPGYDTHGVPIELQVEKEIGSKSKGDIVKYGVDKFISRCKEFATEYIDIMNKEFTDLGVWMDWKDPYLTLDDKYMEAIWAAFKEADKKKLLYLGKYPVHVCTRCGTAVAYNEIEYGKQKDNSIFVKFPLKKKKNTYLIIWTTTPWTLPGNTGVMANPDADYQEVEVMEGERWIMAKELIPGLMAKLERGFTVKDDFKGKKMEGWEYENPLAKDLNLKLKNAYKVVLSARYVTIEDGTGLVHCAPGHGKEDYEVGKENGLDAPSPVGSDGILTKEAGKYAGKRARHVDSEIIEDLEKSGKLVYKMTYDHDYPLCWRDKSPLIMISQPQWFLGISKIHDKLLKENDKNNWIPGWMKLRMKAWLEGISDWPISRQRYWGTPLPIWITSDGKDKIVIGSLEELEKLSGQKVADMHKPGIDEIVINRDGKEYRRVSEVLDVWFDSGVSSWAALGYPSDKVKFKKYWPADLNIEGKDQVRGWWNSQMILSQILFDEKPFDAVNVHGMILDLNKRKMSKSEGNATSPAEIISKFGRDYLRYYLAKFSKAEDFSYNEAEMKEIGKMFMMLGNIHSFVGQIQSEKSKVEIEDKWILSKYNNLVSEVTELYNKYLYPEIIQKIENFLIQDLSRTYIKMIRDRSEEVKDLIQEIEIGVLQLLAPIIPFSTEKIWFDLKERKNVREESIHLSELPKSDKKKINEKLEKEFDQVLKVIELGLAERDKEKIGLRWPIAKITVNCKDAIDKSFNEIILRQLNVKKIEMKKGEVLEIKLDTKMTHELEGEGFAREIARKVQAERKNAGLKKTDLIELKMSVSGKLKDFLKKNLDFLVERTNSKKIEFSDDILMENGIVFTVKDEKISIIFRNL